MRFGAQPVVDQGGTTGGGGSTRSGGYRRYRPRRPPEYGGGWGTFAPPKVPGTRAPEANLPPGFQGLPPELQQAFLDQRRQLLLGFGSQELARQIMGVQADPSRLRGISADPNSMSTLGQLARGFQADTGQQRSALQRANLSYSGAAQQAAGDLEQSYTARKAAALQQLRDALEGQTGGIQKALASPQGTATLPATWSPAMKSDFAQRVFSGAAWASAHNPDFNAGKPSVWDASQMGRGELPQPGQLVWSGSQWTVASKDSRRGVVFRDPQTGKVVNIKGLSTPW